MTKTQRLTPAIISRIFLREAHRRMLERKNADAALVYQQQLQKLKEVTKLEVVKD